MDDCVYCKIANKTIPSYILYEDNDIICVLDILPPSKGSFLIFPKLHIEDYTSLSDEINQKMFTISKYISIILKNKLKFDGLNILLSSGKLVKNINILLFKLYQDLKMTILKYI